MSGKSVGTALERRSAYSSCEASMWQRAVRSVPGEQKGVISRPSASPHLLVQQLPSSNNSRASEEHHVTINKVSQQCAHAGGVR